KTTLNITLDGKDLFGPVTLSNDVNNLLTGNEAIKLGAYGDKNSQVLIELGNTPGDGGTDPGNEKLVDITDNKLEEGDLKIISGDGNVTYNEDGSATFRVTSTQKNRIVYNQMKAIKNGVFEADV
ncbi:hypothetical protein ELE02_35640, partial [Klebsiella pneumoniae]|nr:hypothetical protein [Klebsiella pneumoniae]